MSHGHEERRRNDRHRIEDGAQAPFQFRFPDPDSPTFESRVHDISGSGLSFLVAPGTPTLEAGDLLHDVVVDLGSGPIRGEMVVLHVTPQFEPGAICGGLFYPLTDDDLLAVRRVCAELAGARA